MAGSWAEESSTAELIKHNQRLLNQEMAYFIGDIHGVNVHHFMERDEFLHADLANDRHGHSRLMEYLRQHNLLPTHWYYGHYPTNYDADYGGIKYRALGIRRVYYHVN